LQSHCDRLFAIARCMATCSIDFGNGNCRFGEENSPRAHCSIQRKYRNHDEYVDVPLNALYVEFRFVIRVD
ncbi:hypothetical protein PENTCL1PPCAC_7640, partial [Pristionchus entomophagus]